MAQKDHDDRCCGFASVEAYDRWKEVEKRYQVLAPTCTPRPLDPQSKDSPALSMTLIATSGRARQAVLALPHGPVETPVFMPVGTQATLKGLTPAQVASLGPQIILSNTYHLANRPGKSIVDKAGGVHRFMGWPRNLLTDSGGYQMVSLLRLAEITEGGVKFKHPATNDSLMLTPEASIRTQNVLGADIIMALDDVVDVTSTDRGRFEEATDRTLRWLDRCIDAHGNPYKQNLFGIVQGGLHEDLRRRSLDGLIERNLPGYAIGGLSGGEVKKDFARIVGLCAAALPAEKPRYVMGVGHPLDIVVCVALGADMFDSVYPTRTARFGTALAPEGPLRLRHSQFAGDDRPIEEGCDCLTCKVYSRSYLHTVVTREATACSLLTMHNVRYMYRLCEKMREAIRAGEFEAFVFQFLGKMYPGDTAPPCWVQEALLTAGIDIVKLFDGKKSQEEADGEAKRRRVAAEQSAKRQLAEERKNSRKRPRLDVLKRFHRKQAL